VVEDDAGMREAVEYSLKREGYRVVTAADGVDGLAKARAEKPDLVVLDLMLPRMSGLDVCRTLRAESDALILMLTAKDSETDKVVGLEVGADDYVTKPFSMRELVARVGALLRRVRQPVGANRKAAARLTAGNLQVDLRAHRVTLAGQPVELKPKEYDLLVFLMENRGRVMSRDVILDRVWGYEYFGDSRTVDVHVRWLREKIEADPAHPKWIETVRGVGYRFEG
jgi:DNA-binding response OmpR family regulator